MYEISWFLRLFIDFLSTSLLFFSLNETKQINEISNLVANKGKTEVTIKVKDIDNELVFKLKNKRLVDRKSINTLKNQDISTIIH